MSKTLIVFAHPNHDSFNFSLLETVAETLRNNGHEIELNDLHAMGFDPVMTAGEIHQQSIPDEILREQAKITWAETLVFIFPIWWWGPPAILKGWLERVLCQDFALKYDVSLNRLVGTLQGRSAIVLTTSSADPASFESTWQAESQTNYVRDILLMCGIQVVKLMNFCNVHSYTPADELKSCQLEVRECVKNLG
jgi:NAD(P)H dehydrogenase (quinone)